MKNRFQKVMMDQRGVALLLALGITTVLIAVSLEANRRIRAAVYATATGRDRLVLIQMATSAVHGAMALLSADDQVPNVDCRLDHWALAENRQKLLSTLGFESGGIDLDIEDERSRIQVNALVNYPSGRKVNPKQRMIWLGLLGEMEPLSEASGSDVTADGVVDAVTDWLDRNDDNAASGLYGAETDYYQGLEPPYECRNGRIDHIGELQLIRGIAPLLFYGNEVQPGISRYLTVHGMATGTGTRMTFDGRININTADLPVIAALLPEAHRDLAASIIEYRTALEEKESIEILADALWYKQAPGCSDLSIAKELITVTSNLYRINARARMAPSVLSITAMVERSTDPESGETRCRIVTWEIS
jgi:general secretion pathway protein K